MEFDDLPTHDPAVPGGPGDPLYRGGSPAGANGHQAYTSGQGPNGFSTDSLRAQSPAQLRQAPQPQTYLDLDNLQWPDVPTHDAKSSAARTAARDKEIQNLPAPPRMGRLTTLPKAKTEELSQKANAKAGDLVDAYQKNVRMAKLNGTAPDPIHKMRAEAALDSAEYFKYLNKGHGNIDTLNQLKSKASASRDQLAVTEKTYQAQRMQQISQQRTTLGR